MDVVLGEVPARIWKRLRDRARRASAAPPGT
jgi:hypothetical protein